MIQDHMSSDGSLLNFNITGAPKGMLFDVYHLLLGLRWWMLLLALFVAYTSIAAVRIATFKPGSIRLLYIRLNTSSVLHSLARSYLLSACALPSCAHHLDLCCHLLG